MPQPHLFNSYNSGMGGVDLHDQTVNNYRICIRGKKWWWPLFTHMINMTVVNAWRIYQLTGDSRLDLLSFTRIIARHYLRLGVPNRAIKRSPASTVPAIALDPHGHFHY